MKKRRALLADHASGTGTPAPASPNAGARVAPKSSPCTPSDFSRDSAWWPSPLPPPFSPRPPGTTSRRVATASPWPRRRRPAFSCSPSEDSPALGSSPCQSARRVDLPQLCRVGGRVAHRRLSGRVRAGRLRGWGSPECGVSGLDLPDRCRPGGRHGPARRTRRSPPTRPRPGDGQTCPRNVKSSTYERKHHA